MIATVIIFEVAAALMIFGLFLSEVIAPKTVSAHLILYSQNVV